MTITNRALRPERRVMLVVLAGIAACSASIGDATTDGNHPRDAAKDAGTRIDVAFKDGGTTTGGVTGSGAGGKGGGAGGRVAGQYIFAAGVRSHARGEDITSSSRPPA